METVYRTLDYLVHPVLCPTTLALMVADVCGHEAHILHDADRRLLC